jgi:DNA-binding CsgD family transcriptional regulator
MGGAESWAAFVSNRLTMREKAVIERLATGAPAKCCCIELGLAPSTISTVVATAARKLGLSSRGQLLRLAGTLLARDDDALDLTTLTAAEGEVLAMVCEGLSNAEIATRRGRSVRTIANQVASILAKTGATSRRQVAVATLRLHRNNDHLR